MQNYVQTVISQYGNSPTLLALIEGMNENIDPTQDIDGFFDTAFNVLTAEGYGLDIWGRIVGLPYGRYIPTSPLTVLDDSDFRPLVLLKALSNISYTSVPSMNQLLLKWLGAGSRAYVVDLGNMQLNYVFEFALTPAQLAIIQTSGIFLHPAGVLTGIVSGVFPVFGFKEMGTEWAWPFDQATFIS